VPFHQTTTIVIGGKLVDVDAGIAADIAAINARSLSTWVSCQGDDGTAGRAQGKDVAHALRGRPGPTDGQADRGRRDGFCRVKECFAKNAFSSFDGVLVS
jgi:hypothetical protein